MATSSDPLRRFSDRVADYVRYRPGYPAEVAVTLAEVAGVGVGTVAADVGSGTGISTELLLRLGCQVFAVEPNREMRAAAENDLSQFPGFRSVDGTAESTTLPDASVDLVLAAQAFHWFEPAKARREFARVLRPGGWVAVLWNTRRTDTSGFLRGYEELLQRFATDYRQVDHRNIDRDALRAFFGGEYLAFVFANEQHFDLVGLRGRLLSSSYAPAVGHPSHDPMLRELERVFAAHQQQGRVRFEYDTELFLGRASGLGAGRSV